MLRQKLEAILSSNIHRKPGLNHSVLRITTQSTSMLLLYVHLLGTFLAMADTESIGKLGRSPPQAELAATCQLSAPD